MTGAALEAISTPMSLLERSRWHWTSWAACVITVVIGLTINCLGSSDAVVVIAVTAAIAPVIVWIIWQDLIEFTISDAAVIALAVLAASGRLAIDRRGDTQTLETLGSIAVDAGLPGVLLLALRELYYRRKGYDGLGLGDVKLAAAGGILVGTIGFSWALLVASLAGLFVVVIGALTRHPLEKIAFGAVLAPALLIVWVVEQTPLLRSSFNW
jgi:leader peptidase (prepilin peptidase)/N-methyltransferase